VHSVARGVLQLQQNAPDYGAERRRLRVLKYRGRKYRGGYHDVTIGTGGLNVFPRLIASEHRSKFLRQRIPTGIQALDELMGGGVDAGSSTLLIGPAGTGKSLIVVTFALAAVRRGEKAALFVFDEELGLLFDRMHDLGLDLEGEKNRGNLRIEQIDAAELSPGEFAHRVRNIVDAESIKTIIIDSLNGYQAAMPAENSALLHIHELLQYLNGQGAVTFLTLAQHGMIGSTITPLDVTYLADAVLFLRFFEARGLVRRAISCLKKRTGSHETAIREYHIGAGGLIVDAPLSDFQGVLQGLPTMVAAHGAAASPGP
jgi:circadian clock protein KaiC